MICPFCGKQYEDGTVFCGECGNYIGRIRDENSSPDIERTMAIPTIKDYERASDAQRERVAAKPANTQETGSSSPAKSAPKRPQEYKADTQRKQPKKESFKEEKNPSQNNVLVFIIAFLVVVVVALATVLGFMAVRTMNQDGDNTTSQEEVLQDNKQKEDTPAKKDKEQEDEEDEEDKEDEEKENADSDGAFEFKYGLNPGNSDRTYSTITSTDFSYKCALPSDFKFKKDFGDRQRYVAKDKSAYIDIGAVKNSNKLSVDAVLANTKSDIGGNSLHDSLGEDWFALSMEKDGICYYQMCYVDEYIRYFEMVFPKEYTDAYELYVEEISDSFVRTE